MFNKTTSYDMFVKTIIDFTSSFKILFQVKKSFQLEYIFLLTLEIGKDIFILFKNIHLVN